VEKATAIGLVLVCIIFLGAFLYNQHLASSTSIAKIQKNYFNATGVFGTQNYYSGGSGYTGAGGGGNSPPSGISFAVYDSPNGSSEINSIDWGSISPGGSSTHDIYLKNTSTQDATLTGFSGSTSNWNPNNASPYFTLSMVYVLDNGTATGLLPSSLGPGEQVHAQLELDVSSNITNIVNFSFDITITAEYG